MATFSGSPEMGRPPVKGVSQKTCQCNYFQELPGQKRFCMSDISLFQTFPGAPISCQTMKLLHLAAGFFLLMTSVRPMMGQDMAPDTFLLLRDVNIYSDRISRFARGQVVETLDSLTRWQHPSGNLSDLLGGFTTTSVRNYGQGTLTTLSIRGSSANHAGLLWNGIRLSPPNIGYVDLSLIQGNFFQEISLLYGGASSMFGSGSIGGGIHLNNRPLFGSGAGKYQAGFSAGSFHTYSLEGKAQVSGEKVFSHTSVSGLGTRNDFSYRDFQGEKVKLPHARVLKGGMIQDLAVKLPGEQYIMGSVWFQYASREIPPTMTESVSAAIQTDRTWRSMLIWKDFNTHNTLEAKLAYFNEFTLYEDSLASVYSGIHSQSAVTAFESTWDWNDRASLFAGTQYTYEHADLDFYQQPENQQNLALYASLRYDLNRIKWKASANVRREFLTGYDAPFLFSLGFDGKIWKSLSGKFSFSRNFRAPTLNERFWQPGGNPELDPEKSWNLEAGIHLDETISGFVFRGRITGYSSWVENWILWLPGTSYWSVENAQEVWSRGLEISGEQVIPAGKARILLAESYTFSRSTYEKKLFDLDASFQKQLIYTPVHRMMIKPGVEFHGFTLLLQGSFTGEIYTAKDNSTALPAYFLLDAVLAKSIKLAHKYPISLQMNLNNVLNKSYQVVPYRPMPGFNFLVSLKAGL